VFAIRASHAFDGEDFRAGGATVLVDDAGIVGVEPVGYEPPSDCELLDYGDATVLPGLIDTHVARRKKSTPWLSRHCAGSSPLV
jgi:imidazolonepropionase-like amidohydrolase